MPLAVFVDKGDLLAKNVLAAYNGRMDGKRRKDSSLGAMLRKYRETAGVTLEEVCTETKPAIHFATLSKIEKGERPLREGLVAAYERAVPKYAELHAVNALARAIALGLNPHQILKAATLASKASDAAEDSSEENR